MTTLSAIGDRPLHWAYPDDRRHAFVLCAGSEELGSLQFEEGARTRSVGELEGHRWILESAPSPRRVTVRPEGSSQVAAIFIPCPTGGGIVSFAGGARFRWSRISLLSGAWCFRCETRKSSVCVSQKTGILKEGGDLTVCADATRLAEAPVLVLLAWYLRVLAFEELSENVAVAL